MTQNVGSQGHRRNRRELSRVCCCERQNFVGEEQFLDEKYVKVFAISFKPRQINVSVHINNGNISPVNSFFNLICVILKVEN